MSHFSDAPIISCETNWVHLGERNVFVRCEVKSRPRVTAVFWVIDDNGTTVSEGQVVKEHWTLMMVSRHHNNINSPHHVLQAHDMKCMIDSWNLAKDLLLIKTIKNKIMMMKTAMLSLVKIKYAPCYEHTRLVNKSTSWSFTTNLLDSEQSLKSSSAFPDPFVRHSCMARIRTWLENLRYLQHVK